MTKEHKVSLLLSDSL